MIIEITVRNCFAFEDEVIFSLKADMRNKKNGANVHKESNFNVLKTAGIYGPNNSGKTCLIKCIRAIKYALLNQKIDLMPNLFSNDPICQLSIKFLSFGKEYFYCFKYDSKKEEYPYEYSQKFKKINTIMKRRFVFLNAILKILSTTVQILMLKRSFNMYHKQIC